MRLPLVVERQLLEQKQGGGAEGGAVREPFRRYPMRCFLAILMVLMFFMGGRRGRGQ